MSDNPSEINVVHNEEKNRFEAVIDEHTARINYTMLGPKTIIFTHTVVPNALKGQGVANIMARYVLDYAHEKELTVIPQCPFVRAYIDRHEEYQDLLGQSTR